MMALKPLALVADAWVSAFFDNRAIDLPHKLYQSSFATEFVQQLPPSLLPLVQWVEDFVGQYGDSSFWVYGARRQTPRL